MDRVHPYGAMQRRWRHARMQSFAERFGITSTTRVLDVGGDAYHWELIDVRPQVTILNVFPPPKALPAGMEWCVGDGCRMPFRDGEFDVVFSNSVIEHLGTPTAQASFASEVRRVGRAYYVQTPNRTFPVEPHLLSPFIHFLPRTWQRRLYPVTGWGLLFRPTREQMDAQFAELRLLGRREFAALFPDATLTTERLAGMDKSLMASWQSPAAARAV